MSEQQGETLFQTLTFSLALAIILPVIFTASAHSWSALGGDARLG